MYLHTVYRIQIRILVFRNSHISMYTNTWDAPDTVFAIYPVNPKAGYPKAGYRVSDIRPDA
jgi:hypothetical protein